MAGVDQIHAGAPAWTPSAKDLATADGQYVGRHRKPERWHFPSLFRVFYVGRHRTRRPS